MRTAYTEKLHIGAQDRNYALELLAKSSKFHDGALIIEYHQRQSCYSITSPKGGYRAVQRAKAAMWNVVLESRTHRGHRLE